MTKLIAQVVNFRTCRCEMLHTGSPVTACLAGVQDCNQTSSPVSRFSSELGA